MIKIQNLFQITKSCTVDLKEYIFRAFETKEVPDSFLKPDGSVKFPGFKRIEEVAKKGRKKVAAEILSREELGDKGSAFVYLLEKEGKEVHVADLKTFCDYRRMNIELLQAAVRNSKTYFGWTGKRITVDEYVNTFGVKDDKPEETLEV